VRSTLDQQQFRSVLGHFATGVTVVTASSASGPSGMTANALCSLSLDPLLLIVCFDEGSRTLATVREARRFGVSVLSAEQHDLPATFASKGPEAEKFAGVGYALEHGVPILEGALAWLVCDVEQLIPGGDHTIGIASVAAMDHGEGTPLLWYRGSYRPL